MKKLFIIILLVLLFGCQPSKAKILIPDGIPHIALGELYQKNFHVDCVSSVDILTSAFIKGEYDFIVAPISLGASLYVRENINYKLALILTLTNMFIISREKINNLYDLNDKSILSFGKNQPLDLCFQNIIKTNELNVDVNYQNTINEVLPFFINKTYDYILVTEPVLSNLLIKQELDIHVFNLSSYINVDFPIQAGVFILNNTTYESSLKVIKKSVENCFRTGFSSSILTDSMSYQVSGVPVINSVIQNANIVYIEANDRKEDIEEYFKFINNSNPNILGNKIPDDDFYYIWIY